MKTVRIGILGLTHDHVWTSLNAFSNLPHGNLAAIADPNQPLLDKAKEQYDCAIYRDHEEMVEKENLDAVCVFCDNATGTERTVWAAERGLHVMVEKPMAATLTGAERMIAAVQKAGVRLMISWPIVWRAQVQEALNLAKRPEFGRIWQFTQRTGHGGVYVECTPYFREWILNKELNGAGALMDLCGYGINMAEVLLGHPERIVAVTGNLGEEKYPVEDNAVVIMLYPQAMATSTGAWGQIGKPSTGYLATIWGTKGTIIVGPGGGGRLWTTSVDRPECVEITPPQPEPHMSSGIAHFVWALTTHNEFHPLCQAATCRNTQEVLEAAIVSSEMHHEVAIPRRQAN